MLLIPKDIYKLDYEKAISLRDVTKLLRDFFIFADIDDCGLAEGKEKLINARIALESARLTLISVIRPDDKNIYFNPNNVQNAWNLMMDNIARIDQRIDQIAKESIEQVEMPLETLRKYEADISYKGRGYTRLKSYQAALLPIARNLVYYPMKMAQQIFNTELTKKDSGEPIKKDSNLFAYLIFYNLFQASQQLGNIYRTGVTTRKLTDSTSYGASTKSNIKSSGQEAIILESSPNNAEVETDPEVDKILEEFNAFPSQNNLGEENNENI